MVYTTLKQIRKHGPCVSSWTALLASLNKTQADDEPLSVRYIRDTLGLDDALWSLRACEGIDREVRLYAVACARDVQHLMPDPRSLAALDVAERFADGLASAEELSATRDAACAAATRYTDAATRYTAAAAAYAAVRDSAAAAAAARDFAAAAAAARDSADSAATLRAKQRERFIAMFCTGDHSK